MADWLSSLLAGLGSGAESLGTSMSEREKRDAAAKQRNMELANELSMKIAEYGLSPDVNLPTTAAVQGIGNVRMPTPDPLTSFAKQISLGQGTGKNMVASPRFDVFNGTEAATGDMSDAATNADMSGAGMRGPVSAYGAPTMPRTKLGMEAAVPDVQAQLGAPPMTTGAGDENLPRMSLIDPTTGQSTRYKRDITQSLPYLSMQAQTKANEEREQVKQDAEYKRQAALAQEQNARTLRDKAAAADDAQRQSQIVLQTYGSKNPLSKRNYDTLTPAEQRSLVTIADAEKNMYEKRSQIEATAAGKSKSVWVMDPKDPTKTILVPEEEAIRQGYGRAPTGGGAGGGKAATLGQGALTPLDDMLTRIDEIEGHAKDLAEGKWKMTQGMQTREGSEFGITHGLIAGDLPWKQMATKAVNATVSTPYSATDYNRYQALMNSTRALGDDIAKVFKGRQNEEAVKREIALAMLTPSDYANPAVVKQKIDRLHHAAKLAALGSPLQAAAANQEQLRRITGVTSSSTLKALTPAQYEAARTHYSDAEIQAQGYTIPGKTP